jgi:hypothetical protein
MCDRLADNFKIIPGDQQFEPEEFFINACSDVCRFFNSQEIECTLTTCDEVDGQACTEGSSNFCRGENGEWTPVVCCGGTWHTDFDSCQECDDSMCSQQNGDVTRYCSGEGYLLQQSCCRTGLDNDDFNWVVGTCSCDHFLGQPCDNPGQGIICQAYDENFNIISQTMHCCEQSDSSNEWQEEECGRSDFSIPNVLP